jgi:hypothetical protein
MNLRVAVETQHHAFANLFFETSDAPPSCDRFTDRAVLHSGIDMVEGEASGVVLPALSTRQLSPTFAYVREDASEPCTS